MLTWQEVLGETVLINEILKKIPSEFYLDIPIVIILIVFVLVCLSVFILAKKSNIKHRWMAWIPWWHQYIISKIANKNFITHFIIPTIILCCAWGYVFTTVLLFIFSMGRFILWWNLWFIYSISAGFWILYFIVMKIKLLHWVSKNTGRWCWTTAGLFFIPFIMFPVVASKYKGWALNKEWEENIDNNGI